MIDTVTLAAQLTATVEALDGVLEVYPTGTIPAAVATHILAVVSGSDLSHNAKVGVSLTDGHLDVRANIAVAATIPTPATVHLVGDAIHDLLMTCVDAGLPLTIAVTVGRIG